MVPALPLELEIPNTKSCRVSRLSITPLEWRKTTMITITMRAIGTILTIVAIIINIMFVPMYLILETTYGGN